MSKENSPAVPYILAMQLVKKSQIIRDQILSCAMSKIGNIHTVTAVLAVQRRRQITVGTIGHMVVIKVILKGFSCWTSEA